MPPNRWPLPNEKLHHPDLQLSQFPESHPPQRQNIPPPAYPPEHRCAKPQYHHGYFQHRTHPQHISSPRKPRHEFSLCLSQTTPCRASESQYPPTQPPLFVLQPHWEHHRQSEAMHRHPHSPSLPAIDPHLDGAHSSSPRPQQTLASHCPH